LLYLLLDGIEFLRRGLAVRRIPNGKPFPGILHHAHANRDVADAHAKVDQAFVLAVGIPFVDVVGSNLEFQ